MYKEGNHTQLSVLRMKDSEAEESSVRWLFRICCLGLDLQGIRLTILQKDLTQRLLSKTLQRMVMRDTKGIKVLFQDCVNLF